MKPKLAISGGKPIRNVLLPYGRQSIDEDDIASVTAALRSDWLTTGPIIADFERKLAQFTGAAHAVAVSSGTAALHAAVNALGIAPGDEVIVPAITFAASANCVLYQRGTPVFADVESDTLLLSPAEVERKISSKTKAILAVDYTGHPCEYEKLRDLADHHHIALISDSCHALGASYKNKPVGSLADLSAFSFHPVKHITTGEGGAITTNDLELAQRMRRFRNHGINSDFRQREQEGSWHYEMIELGFNYRITDFQCALGISQLKKLPSWIERRQQIAKTYLDAFSGQYGLESLVVRDSVSHAYHLFVIRLALERLSADRTFIFKALRAEGIGVNVHYLPVHLHPFYRKQLGTGPGLCPIAEAEYERILSLPIYPGMSDTDVENTIEACLKVLRAVRA